VKLKKISGRVLLSALVILVLFSLPGQAVDSVRRTSPLLKIIFADNLIHMVCYGELAFITWWDHSRQRTDPLGRGKIFLYCFFYSFFIEVYQLALPFRSFELGDLFFNAVGILAALFITCFI
jgi:glycopeptide antibiotics resistance protein